MEEKKRRGRGDQVLVLEFCQGQWGMRRRGRQRQKLQWKKRNVEDVAARWCLRRIVRDNGKKRDMRLDEGECR